MIASRGATMAVDWEQRDRLLAAAAASGCERAKAALDASDLGALLLFDPNNIRYVTSTHIGEWARDKNARFVLLPRRCRPGPVGLRLGREAPPDVRAVAARRRAGAPASRACAARCRTQTGVPGHAGRDHRLRGAARARPRGRAARHRHDRHGHARGAARARASTPTDAQPVMLAARKIKTEDEIALLDHAAAIVDAVYERIYRARCARASASTRSSPTRAAAVRAGLRAGRGDQRRLRRPLQPASARLLRPPAAARATRRSSTSSTRSWATGRATTARSASAARQRGAARRLQAVPRVARRRDRPRPARASRPTRSPRSGRPPQELGFPSEEACFGLQFGHGLGVGLYEAPMISRLHSFDDPVEIEEGMVFALETYCAGDGRPVGGADRGGGRS